MKNFKNIIITGASSGIGQELAGQFSNLGAENILLIGRSEKRLKACAKKIKANGEIAVCSVTDYNKLSEKIDKFCQKFKPDLLIANAGISAGSSNGLEDKEQVDAILNTNILGVTNSIYACLPYFKKQKYGNIAIISSLASYLPLASAPSYASAKACVRFLGLSLYSDFKKDNIHITTICPGYIKTPLTDKNNFPMPQLMEVDVAGQKIIKAIRKEKIYYNFPKLFFLSLSLIRILPTFAQVKILAALPKK